MTATKVRLEFGFLAYFGWILFFISFFWFVLGMAFVQAQTTVITFSTFCLLAGLLLLNIDVHKHRPVTGMSQSIWTLLFIADFLYWFVVNNLFLNKFDTFPNYFFILTWISAGILMAYDQYRSGQLSPFQVLAYVLLSILCVIYLTLQPIVIIFLILFFPYLGLFALYYQSKRQNKSISIFHKISVLFFLGSAIFGIFASAETDNILRVLCLISPVYGVFLLFLGSLCGIKSSISISSTNIVGNAKGYIINERYQVISNLKPGGMSQVSLVKDLTTNKKCVIKIPRIGENENSDVNVTKLRVEADYLRRFNHPNIVKFVDTFMYSNLPCLVEEYIEGETLMKVYSVKQASETAMKNLALQMIDALEYIHCHNVIHRDFNPKNIMVRTDATIVIIDFGTIARTNDGDTIAVTTPNFAVPELQRGEAYISSDLYSLANVLYYILTSKPPKSIDSQGVIYELSSRNISERIIRCIAQARNFSPDNRFYSISAMKKALLG
jgi:tRNA A-37 threonylcarbamoyl transferase component Bud32